MKPRRPRSQFVALATVGLIVFVGEGLLLLFIPESPGPSPVSIVILLAGLAVAIVGAIGLRRNPK